MPPSFAAASRQRTARPRESPSAEGHHLRRDRVRYCPCTWMYGRIPEGGEMRKILVLAVIAVAAAVPASAAAKEIVGLTVCGATGCATERGGSISGSLHEGPSGPLGGTGAAVAPAKPGPWYRGSVLAGEGGKVYGRIPFYYVPDAKLIVLPGAGAQTTTWQHASGAWREAIERVADGMKPFPAPTISRVSVDGTNPADPQSYL